MISENNPISSLQHRKHTYLIHLQYLGIGFSGWQKQANARTVQGTLERSIRYVLGHEDFRILGASRTDSGVSANHAVCMLFLKNSLELDQFVSLLNEHTPSEIRILFAEIVSPTFNVIQDVVAKEYHYHMAFGDKFHPFLSGQLAYFFKEVDIRLMKEAAGLFVGTWDFRRFCAVDKISENYVRTIYSSKIVPYANSGNADTPSNAITYKVVGNGFLKQQVRIMVHAIVAVGQGNLSLEGLKEALLDENKVPIMPPAPALGLVLEKVNFK